MSPHEVIALMELNAELLAALIGMLNFVEQCKAAGCPSCCGYIETARTVIAKAGGRS